jgi:hypothetical protein
MTSFKALDSDLTPQQVLRGLELTLADLPQEEQGPHLAFLEQVAKEDGDFQRLRAIREYRRRHHAPPMLRFC